MADRFPLILNTNANQIQEIASGDTLDLSGTNIKGVGIITATNLSGNIIAGAGTSDIVAGIATITDLRVGGNTTFSEDLVVTGNARVTGILTVGTSSIILNDSANTIKVGTALTLGHTQGLQFHTQNLHSQGFEVNQINASGIITATEADINGDLDVDGHTNLDNVSIAGVTTMSGNLSLESTYPRIFLKDTNHNPDFSILNNDGNLGFRDDTNGEYRLQILGTGETKVYHNLIVDKDLDVDGHTNLDNVSIAGVTTFAGDATFAGNVSIGGTLTYEDVTNIDSVGIVTARNGLKVTGGTSNFSGASHFVGIARFNETIVGTARTAIKLTCTDESTDTTTYPLFVAATTGDQFPKTGTNLSFNSANGTLTATTFSGALTGTASGNATITSNGNNRIITGGSGNALNGESSLTYDTYLSIINSRNDTNFTDNSAPGTVNGIFINNSQTTNGVFSALSVSASDTNGTNQSASFIAKSVNGGYVPEVHITQRTANNTNESNIKITSARSVELNYQGTKKLHTNTNGIVVSGGAYFNAASITGTPYLYLYGYAGNDGTQRGVTIEGNEAALEIVSSPSGNHSSSILLRNLNEGFAFINDHDENKLTLRQFTAVSDNFNAHGTGNGLSALKTIADFNENGSVDLYWNNNLRIRTHEHGTIVKGGANNVHIYLQDNGGTQRGEVYANNSNQVGFLDETGNWAVNFDRNGSSYCFSHFLPGTNDTHDLGSTGVRWRNVYVNDLQLSNESKKDGGGNDVDGTWGDYTIQEGESDLFLINNRSGKKYKFNLTEVS